MADAASKERWQHTSAIMALLANIHRDLKRSRPFRPADFNPYERKSSRLFIQIDKDKDGLSLFREAFSQFK